MNRYNEPQSSSGGDFRRARSWDEDNDERDSRDWSRRGEPMRGEARGRSGWETRRGMDDEERRSERSYGRDWDERGEYGGGDYGASESSGRYGYGGASQSRRQGHYGGERGGDVMGGAYPERGWGNFQRDDERNWRSRSIARPMPAGYGYGASSVGNYSQRPYGQDDMFAVGGQNPQRDYGIDEGYRERGSSYASGRYGAFDERGATPYAGAGSGEGRGLSGYGQEHGMRGSRDMWGSEGRNADRQSFRGRGPKGYTRSDERLKEDICERLSDDPQIDASEIEVTCKNGVVTLTGEVSQRWMKHRVEDTIDACSGVREIENRLRVGSMQSRGRREDETTNGAKSDNTGGTTTATQVSSSSTKKQ